MHLNHRAFTLIEILVVCAILAIAATIAIPAIGNGYDSIRVPSAARMVMSDILYAQNSAITTQNRTFMYFLDDTQATSRKAYTVAYFPGQTVAPSLNFTQVNAATSCSITAGGVSGTILKQPTTQSRYLVQFGTSNNNAPGPLSRTIITSVKKKTDGSNVSVLGFDSLGQPLDSAGAVLTDTVVITLANVRGDVTQTLEISPITGEINVP